MTGQEPGKSDSPVAARVMSGIADKIAAGVFPVGSVLPGCRKLASKLGVNKNTVAKAFSLLKETGVVKSLPGQGMLVVRRPTVDLKGAENSVEASFDEALYRARVTGIGADQVQRMFESSLSKWYKTQQLSLTLVECNPYDAASLANHVRMELPVTVTPVLLSEFLENAEGIAKESDLIVTTFYHLAEVNAVLGSSSSAKVVALQDRPNVHSLLALSKLQATRIGVVAVNERTVRILEDLIGMAGHKVSHRALLEDPDEVRRLLYSVDTAVVSARCLQGIDKFAPKIPVTAVVFEVDVQSMELLRNMVTEVLEKRLSGPPSQDDS